MSSLLSALSGSSSTSGLSQLLQSFGGTNAATAASGMVAAATSHHHHGGGGLFKQIESAVSSALQSSPTAATTDPNTIVQNAIASVLKNALNGGSSASDGDNDHSPTSSSNPTGATSTQQGFASALQKAGITSQQFEGDFSAAVQSLQSDSSSNGSALLQSLPPGLLIDTTA